VKNAKAGANTTLIPDEEGLYLEPPPKGRKWWQYWYHFNRNATYPGEMLLKEFLEPIGLTQKVFANHPVWAYAYLNDVINGHRQKKWGNKLIVHNCVTP